MKNDVINGAAQIYYNENVVGEPLTEDIPIECFEAGAQFVIDSQKKRNNCNIPKGISYNSKSKIMKEKYAKIVENVEKIIKVSGFYITAEGDDTIRISSATWTIEKDFYFDTPEELEEFRGEIKKLFEFHCGEVTSVITFEEHQAELDIEEDEVYEAHPVRYLIRDRKNYKIANSIASYSGGVGDGIHFELPHWMSEDGYNGNNTTIINSKNDEYWEILKEAAGRLERKIRDNEYNLRNAKRNLQLIQNEIKHKK